jgi:hypothetical protein
MSYWQPNIAIVGSRTFNDYEYMHAKMHELVDSEKFQMLFWRGGNYKTYPSAIVSGGAKGADKLAEKYALDHGHSLFVYQPDWERYGKSAGYKRNQQIVDNSDVLAAFWDGESRGTKHSIDLAVKQKKLVQIYTDWKGKDDRLPAFSS